MPDSSEVRRSTKTISHVSAKSERRPDFRPEAPELVEGLLPPHAGQVGEDDERLEPEHLLHLAQGVARLLRRADDPGLDSPCALRA